MKRFTRGQKVNAGGFDAIIVDPEPQRPDGATSADDWVVTVQITDDRTTLNGCVIRCPLARIVEAKR